MIFEIVCKNCNSICRDQVPLLVKCGSMNLICPDCDCILFSFYDEEHPLTKWVKGLKK